ncbi:MAG: phospho-N-acetylmuramoyl-pentapeptide-transferase [Candidatus Eremiobacteraeota bacterium]|nr:phospho-N-acetylmuramoyl-pentapeptide-transferase [Candidatus Eremiobacteraeota bacterium]
MSWTSILLAVLFGFAITLAAGALLLRLLPRFQLRQTAYEDAPQTHQSKTGTPTMGGLAILAALIPPLVLFYASDRLGEALVLLVFACAAIGSVDDFLGTRGGRARGLRARTKYLATALVAVVFLRFVATALPHSAGFFPIFSAGTLTIDAPFWLWLTLGTIAITGTVHAVNLTDGLDGLAAGTIIAPLAATFAIAVSYHEFARTSWPVVLLLAIGGCLAFLVYNYHPAKMFMGDTGSLALGALLSGAAILSGEMLLLILIGGVFVAEALSVIVQVAYFKLTRRRILRMSPLHHHFELGGMKEPAVTLRFWTASILCSVVGWAVVR